MIGFIDIGRDCNPDLMDQTNREGLIHNDAVDDLRRLVYFVVQAVESEQPADVATECGLVDGAVVGHGEDGGGNEAAEVDVVHVESPSRMAESRAIRVSFGGCQRLRDAL